MRRIKDIFVFLDCPFRPPALLLFSTLAFSAYFDGPAFMGLGTPIAGLRTMAPALRIIFLHVDVDPNRPLFLRT